MLTADAAVSPALGQGWILNATDSTVRVAGFPGFCLDMDYSDPPEARSIITYACNDDSIHTVKNQVWHYFPQNLSFVNGNNHGCLTSLPGGGAGVRVCDPSNTAQRIGLDRALGGGTVAIYNNASSTATRLCLEWGGQGSMLSQATLLVERLAPLLAGVSGEQVIVGCFGWLADLVTDWQGYENQPLPYVKSFL